MITIDTVGVTVGCDISRFIASLPDALSSVLDGATIDEIMAIDEGLVMRLHEAMPPLHITVGGGETVQRMPLESVRGIVANLARQAGGAR